MPRLRVAWYALLAAAVGLQNLALGEGGMPLLWCSSLTAGLGLALTAIAVLVAARASDLSSAVRWSELSLYGDVLIGLVAVHLSGGTESMVVLALAGPAALQVTRRPGRSVGLGLAASIGYLAYAGLLPRAAHVDLRIEVVKALGLVMTTAAIATGGREVQRLRVRDSRAYGLAIARIGDLEQRLDSARAERVSSGLADRARGEILADIGHEIRTPMTSIIGLSKLCLEGEQDPTRREHLRCVQGSAGSLLRTLDDLVDLSGVETGAVEVREEPFDLRAVLADKLPPLEARAYGKGLSLHCRVAPEVPRTLLGDGLRLAQVVGRLTANALRDTEYGSVAVRADAERDGTLVLRVIDTGAGYEPDQLDRLLQAAPGVETGSGQGLGLPLVRRLVVAMGGRIEAVSAPSSGSEFRVVLRLREGAAPDAGARPVGEGRRVLLAAADAVDGACLSEIIEGCGATLEHWSGGALPDVASVATGAPALVVVDGAALHADAEGFRRLVDTLPPRRVVVVASLADEVTGDALRPFGDRVLRLDRPVLAPAFEALLHGAVEQVEAPAPVAPRPSTFNTGSRGGDTFGTGSAAQAVRTAARRASRPLRLLLAEDDAANRRLFRAVLEGWGHEVLAVSDGEAAVKRFAEAPVDAVLMDLQLPILDGIEATRRLRNLGSAGAEVPILALTSSSLAEEAERCADAGMDGHLAKPIDLPALFEWLEHQAQRRRGVA